MDINSIVMQSKEIDATDLNGDTVMMNLEKGKYFALNSIGSRIWELIDEKKVVNQVIDELLEEYEVDKETCVETVIIFLNRLKDEELIKVF